MFTKRTKKLVVVAVLASLTGIPAWCNKTEAADGMAYREQQQEGMAYRERQDQEDAAAYRQRDERRYNVDWDRDNATRTWKKLSDNERVEYIRHLKQTSEGWDELEKEYRGENPLGYARGTRVDREGKRILEEKRKNNGNNHDYDDENGMNAFNRTHGRGDDDTNGMDAFNRTHGRGDDDENGMDAFNRTHGRSDDDTNGMDAFNRTHGR